MCGSFLEKNCVLRNLHKANSCQTEYLEFRASQESRKAKLSLKVNEIKFYPKGKKIQIRKVCVQSWKEKSYLFPIPIIEILANYEEIVKLN